MNPKISTSAAGQALIFCLTKTMSFYKEDRVRGKCLTKLSFSSQMSNEILEQSCAQVLPVYQGLTCRNCIFSCWKRDFKHATIFGIQCIVETSKWAHDWVYVMYTYIIDYNRIYI